MSNRYKMPIVDFMQFKKYMSSKEVMRWAYLNYKNKVTFQQMIREEKYLKEHHKLLIIFKTCKYYLYKTFFASSVMSL